jgi:hypothetical protein
VRGNAGVHALHLDELQRRHLGPILQNSISAEKLFGQIIIREFCGQISTQSSIYT